MLYMYLFLSVIQLLDCRLKADWSPVQCLSTALSSYASLMVHAVHLTAYFQRFVCVFLPEI